MRHIGKPKIKAIPTEYNGQLYRSRLEARTAVYFDASGFDYVYEPEGMEIDGVKYLGDFFLKGVTCDWNDHDCVGYTSDDRSFTLIVECKGVFDEYDELKTRTAYDAGFNLLVLEELPRGGDADALEVYMSDFGPKKNTLFYHGRKCDKEKCDIFEDQSFQDCSFRNWLEDPGDVQPKYVDAFKQGFCPWSSPYFDDVGFFIAPSIDGHPKIIEAKLDFLDHWSDKCKEIDLDVMLFALDKANKAKFEFGATPKLNLDWARQRAQIKEQRSKREKRKQRCRNCLFGSEEPGVCTQGYDLNSDSCDEYIDVQELRKWEESEEAQTEVKEYLEQPNAHQADEREQCSQSPPSAPDHELFWSILLPKLDGPVEKPVFAILSDAKLAEGMLKGEILEIQISDKVDDKDLFSEDVLLSIAEQAGALAGHPVKTKIVWVDQDEAQQCPP